MRLDSRCGGRTGRHAPAPHTLPARLLSNDLTKRLMWSGLLAAIGALSTILANRAAAALWQRAFHEDPPDF